MVTKMRGKKPDVVVADFASLTAVRDAAAKILDRYPQIHILINNAGLFRQAGISRRMATR